MRRLTRSQRRMLDAVALYDGGDLSEAYHEYREIYWTFNGDSLPYALAWRNADRTASVLIRLGLITVDGDTVTLTDAGRQARDSD